MKKTDPVILKALRTYVAEHPQETYKQLASRFNVSEITVKRHCAGVVARTPGRKPTSGALSGQSAADRFWDRVERISEDCWPWKGSTNNSGYGFTQFDGTKQGVHRIAYALASGPIPDGLEIDHTCRNRICCNPTHLEPVTHAENMERVRSGQIIRTQAEATQPSSAPTGTVHSKLFPLNLDRIGLDDESPLLPDEEVLDGEIIWDPVKEPFFRFAVRGSSNGVHSFVIARSEKHAREVFESFWCRGLSLKFIRLGTVDMTRIYSSRYRLEHEFATWSKTPFGANFLAERDEMQTREQERRRCEEEERMLEKYFAQQEVRERKAKAKLPIQKRAAARNVHHCANPEAYPDEAYDLAEYYCD